MIVKKKLIDKLQFSSRSVWGIQGQDETIIIKGYRGKTKTLLRYRSKSELFRLNGEDRTIDP